MGLLYLLLRLFYCGEIPVLLSILYNSPVPFSLGKVAPHNRTCSVWFTSICKSNYVLILHTSPELCTCSTYYQFSGFKEYLHYSLNTNVSASIHRLISPSKS